MKREQELYSKFTKDISEEIYKNSYNNNDFHYFKKSLIENGTFDELFDFE